MSLKISTNKIKRRLFGLAALVTFAALALAVLTPVAGSILPNSLTPKAHAESLPAYNYTKTFDTTNGSAWGNGVATDSDGNVYVTGGFTGTVVFDGTGGSDSATASIEGAFITKYNANGTYGWTKTFDTSSGQADGLGIAVDSNGNIYVTGYFTGTVVFDGTGGSDSQTDAGGDDDAFITKYNANGTYGWTKSFDTTNGKASGFSVATDSSGNIYVTGYFTGTVVFDGTGGSDSQTDAGGDDDAFITKYNANGTYGWTKTFDTSSGQADGLGVAVDSNGNIYVTGYFTGTVVFDGTGGSDSQTDAGGDDDAFITKYNANGTYGWTKSFDTTNGRAIGYGIATDSNGNIYVTGYFTGTVVFDGTGGSDSQTEDNGSAFITKYNADGTYAWTKSFDTSASGSYAEGDAITTDADGNIYVTGLFNGVVTFDGTGGSDNSANEIDEVQYITKYNADGTYAWTKYQDTSDPDAEACYSSDTCGSVAVSNTTGQVFYAGGFSGTITFDGPGGSDSQTDAGSNGDMFLTSYTAFVPDSGSSQSGSSSSGSSSSPSSGSAPDTPDTGYGQPASSVGSLVAALITGAIISTGAGLFVFYHQKRPRTHYACKHH